MPDLPPELLNARARFWKCLNPAHSRVTWTGDVAACGTCGLTSVMTREFAVGVQRYERKRIAAAVRELHSAAMDYFNEMGAYAVGPPAEWRSEARYAQAEATVNALLHRQEATAP